jgi:hypothetical protein
MPQGPRNDLPEARGRINFVKRTTYEKIKATLAGLETIFSERDFEWVQTNKGKRVRLKRKIPFKKKKFLPFEVILLIDPPESEGGAVTYKISVAPGRVNERIPDLTEALIDHEPDNLWDEANPDQLAEFDIEVGESVYIKVEVDEDGGVGIDDPQVEPVLIEVGEDDIESAHYQPKVDDETPDGVVGTYYYKLARLINGPSGAPELENHLAGSHLDHWRDLPSILNTSNDATETGLISKKWDQDARAYKLRPLIREFGKLIIRTDPDNVVVRGNKRDGLIKVFLGDFEQSEPFVEWNDGLWKTGEEINGDEDPLPDPLELELKLAAVQERAANPQVRVSQVGLVGRVFQVEGNGRNGFLAVNGELIASWVDGLWEQNGTVDIEIDGLPPGDLGDILYHDGNDWVTLAAPLGPTAVTGAQWLLASGGGAPFWVDSSTLP